MSSNLTAEEKASLLLSKLVKGKEVYRIFAKNMKEELEISGHPIHHWEEQFKISVPTDNLTPALCKQLDMKLMELNQEAAFYQAVAAAKHQLIKRGSEASYNEKFWGIVQDHKSQGKRLPAANTLDTMARIHNEDIEAALTIAEIENRFWKDILDHLSTCRKLIENASLNISVEMKALTNERYLDSMNKQQR